MIALTRAEIRRIHALFCRRYLTTSTRGPLPPLVLTCEPGIGLSVRYHRSHLAVELVLPGDRPSSAGSIALPLDALAELEGRDESIVNLDASAFDRVVARWTDRGVPRSREYVVGDRPPPFPDPPSRFDPCPVGLLDALASAVDVAGEDSSRYALGSIQLRGGSGEVVATDGRQLLIQSGFRFCWDDDVLVHASPMFACRALPRDLAATIGRTDSHVVLRLGAITLWLAIRADVRYPKVDDVVPSENARFTRLRLDSTDIKTLADVLPHLPGAETSDAVTLDLNGAIAIRAKDPGDGPPTELILPRSSYVGDPIRIATDRTYLARALDLGATEIRLTGKNAPVSGRGAGKTYAWQPLPSDLAIEPAPNAVRLESIPAKTPNALPRRPTVSLPPPVRESSPRETPATSLIQEAESLHATLSEAKAKAGRLVIALRRQRKQNKLVAETLRSLEQLREVAG